MALAFRGDKLAGIVFGHTSSRGAETALGRIANSSRQSLKISIDWDWGEESTFVGDLAERLRLYAAGKRIRFSDVTIDETHLTPFARRVVAACRRIKWGRFRTYGELAVECGSSGAARAVGQVMAQNRFPLVVPCHRVLGANGSLGGFSAPQGLPMKRRLLELEQANRE
jgi:methylated-DNA-[protein]-cysteine S-methyltransferase